MFPPTFGKYFIENNTCLHRLSDKKSNSYHRQKAYKEKATNDSAYDTDAPSIYSPCPIESCVGIVLHIIQGIEKTHPLIKYNCTEYKEINDGP